MFVVYSTCSLMKFMYQAVRACRMGDLLKEIFNPYSVKMSECFLILLE